jgi:hypothetical protein
MERKSEGVGARECKSGEVKFDSSAATDRSGKNSIFGYFPTATRTDGDT